LSALADEAGVTLIELAIAFVLEHPAVTSPIIGPRTMKHLESQLSATEVHLSATSWTVSMRSTLRAPT
jgi:aryl-alcohol dehydrogenase-like predicted oxidoreductase